MLHCRVEELVPTSIFGPILRDHVHEWNATESPRRVHSSWPTMTRLATSFNIRLDPGKSSHREILWSLEATRFVFKIIPSLWNLRGTSAAVLPRRLCQNCQNDAKTYKLISRFQDFTRSYFKSAIRVLSDTETGSVVVSILTGHGRARS